MIKRFNAYLGETRTRALFVLLAVTGLTSLILNAVDAPWVTLVQSLLVSAFIVGGTGIVLSAMPTEERQRWLTILAPAYGLVILAVTIMREYSTLLLGGAIGWMIAASLIFKPRSPMAYREAVRALRKNEYGEAVKAMDELIRAEPQNPNHYRFRAELLRLWGKLDRARRDYVKMSELDPKSAVAYNGLAEVDLQAQNYARARESALKAYALAPEEWVAAYNLGMIEDRMGESADAVQHLNEALKAHVPDVRHQMLIHFYLVRNHARLNDLNAAHAALETLRKHRKGLGDWETILNSDQAETLRAVLGDDIKTAEALMNGDLDVAALADTRAGRTQA